jgi:hypothetical protein
VIRAIYRSIRTGKPIGLRALPALEDKIRPHAGMAMNLPSIEKPKQFHAKSPHS